MAAAERLKRVVGMLRLAPALEVAWVPAYAGMTEGGMGVAEGGCAELRAELSEIPATSAGMTEA